MKVKFLALVSISVLGMSCGSAKLAADKKSQPASKPVAASKADDKQASKADKRLQLTLPDSVRQASALQAIEVGQSSQTDQFSLESKHIRVSCDDKAQQPKLADLKKQRLQGILTLALDVSMAERRGGQWGGYPGVAYENREALPMPAVGAAPQEGIGGGPIVATDSNCTWYSNSVQVCEARPTAYPAQYPDDEMAVATEPQDCKIDARTGATICSSISVAPQSPQILDQPMWLPPSAATYPPDLFLAYSDYITVPYTCSGKLNVDLVNLQGAATYVLHAGLQDAAGTPLYQGSTEPFGLSGDRLKLKMHEIKTGNVSIDMIFN